MYNLKIRDFRDSEQIQLVHYGYDVLTKEDNNRELTDLDIEWNDYFKRKKENELDDKMSDCGIDYNPFTNSYMQIIGITKDGFFKIKEINKTSAKKVVKDYDFFKMNKYEKKEYLKKLSMKNECNLKRCITSIYDYARCNKWEWFLTFTFKDANIRYDYIECRKKISLWLKNNKVRYAPDLKYLVIPERHKDGAYHFHGLLSNIGDIKINPATNYHTKELIYNNGNLVYNFSKFSYGWTAATQVKDTKRVSGYICKYITKDLLDNVPDKQRYLCSKGLNKPIVDKFNVSNLEDAFKQVMEIYGYLPQIDFCKTVTNIYRDAKQTYYEMKL